MDGDYRMCVRCVMDGTAEEIRFDENGVCSFCYYFDKHVRPILERSRIGAIADVFQEVFNVY